ncbi:MAG: M15 family metallopeptidase [Alphaproteobacteria bacterium]|nr:M15 family metallopeptidase [Alphaproteobacteria bacterium]
MSARIILVAATLLGAASCSPGEVSFDPKPPPHAAAPKASPAQEAQLTVGDISQRETPPQPLDGKEPSVEPEAMALEILMGSLDPRTDRDFSAVPASIASRQGLYGRKEAVDSLVRMAEAARTDGVNLTVVSAFRSFSDQKRIWEDKWTGSTRVEGGRLPDTVPDPSQRALKILEYSSMPGTSRHHWGTDFDLNSLESSYFARGDGRRVYEWLTVHARQFGFCQVYSPKGVDRPEGYNQEEWHWSYMPIASRMLGDYLTQISPSRISGFKGSETASDINVVNRYVRGVNPACSGP